MAEIQAKALYDFDGDVENGELNFKSGDTLFIVEQDVGDGWWEARNYVGDQGLIPQAYVQVIEPPEPSFPPPPPPMPSAPPDISQNGWDDGRGYNYNPPPDKQQSFDGWDEDFDDEDDDRSSNSTGGAPQHQQDLQGNGNFGLSQARPRRENAAGSPPGDMSKYGTVKKSFNRFSTFAKAGGEAFMMGQYTGNVSEADLIKIIETEDGIEWDRPDAPYTCAVKSPKKESKLKGLKSFIAYQITPSFSNIQVSRRYKHFDWLHIRLEEKFTCIPIPPLPDKAISEKIRLDNIYESSSLKDKGRYEEEFIDSRMKLLQLWIDRITRHPVLSRSDVFNHFLTCTDEKKWKQGKRKAEKDEYTGGKFFLTLQTPPNSLHMGDVDGKMENFCKFVQNMDHNVRGMLAVAYDNRKKHVGPYKREFQKIGNSFKSLATTFNLDTRQSSRALTGAIDITGETYNEIGNMFEKQPKNDLEPLMDTLNEYKGILGQFPDVMKVHEGAVGKAKECQKLSNEGKMVESAVQSVTQRADVISFGTMAEISHFQSSRVEDFKAIMTTYLQEQIKFYSEITSKLERALQHVQNS